VKRWPIICLLLVTAAPAAYQPSRGVTLVVNGGGAAITTGIQNGSVVKIPFGFTINGWNMTCYPSGSITVDILRSANGAGTPSASIVGAGTKPAISSNVEASSAPASWTSTLLTAKDNVLLQVTAADGTVASATLVLYP
jgi:hypothetical protein